MCLLRLRLLGTLLVFVLLSPLHAQPNLAGTPRLKLALERLNVLGSVLMIAAHPDDENNALLAYFARGRHLRTAYLSATRGEGGQNLIGPEQGEMLGILRTQELLAARRIDGAEQFFTRAVDFGFSKSAEETMAKWGREETLSDMVWVIRRFRPDIVILRFSGTNRDGHGHHQASAILGKEAFLAAGDPSRFPEQLKHVEPWKPARLFFNVFAFTAEQARSAAAIPNRIEIETGDYHPLLGYSYTEIAGMSRSMHRSQAFGSMERRGPSKNYLLLIEGTPASAGAFDGIDTSWKRVPGGAEIGRILREAADTFVPEHPEKTVPRLLEARRRAAAIRHPWARIKAAEIEEAVALCAGLWLDAPAGRYAALPGSTLPVNATVINRSAFPFSLANVSLDSSPAGPGPSELGYNQVRVNTLKWNLPASEPYSQPFWLRKPLRGARYAIDDPNLIGQPDRPPVLTVRFELQAQDQILGFTRPVHYRYADPARGELTRPLDVVPAVAVNLPERVFVFPDTRPRKLQVQLRANAPGQSGGLRLELPPGWTAEPASQPFSLANQGDEAALSFQVLPPPAAGNGSARAVASVGGRDIACGMDTVAYPHITPQTVFPPSEARLVRTDVKVLARTVGYIMGAGDEVPGALRQLGCDVALLSPQDLASGDLSRFNAIVTGVRAYNVRPDLRANQDRLLEYVRGGGTLVIQYNVAEGGPGSRETGALQKIGPAPLRIGRARVSVEEAPVTFTSPGSPLLNAPNRITPADFEGWVQERGLYFASQWDPAYQTVLETHDPGEAPQAGGMLYLRYGKGVYVFSAYSWFRQLPAGVPGAYRIFANLLSAGKTVQ
ncbi:MAG: PIG-L family deacetylase [Bryobacterales bacterium]|nr:PIG-L family deacetylase [Bryobacterales bacterium]